MHTNSTPHSQFNLLERLRQPILTIPLCQSWITFVHIVTIRVLHRYKLTPNPSPPTEEYADRVQTLYLYGVLDGLAEGGEENGGNSMQRDE